MVYAGTDGAGVYDIDQEPRILVEQTNDPLITDELGGQDSFSVTLTTVPTDNVSLTLSSSNTEEGVVDPTTMLFTPENALTPQFATVTGVSLIASGRPFFAAT